MVCGAACMMTTLAEARVDTGSTCSHDSDDDAGGGARGRWLHFRSVLQEQDEATRARRYRFLKQSKKKKLTLYLELKKIQ